jgi:hypothetical protein
MMMKELWLTEKRISKYICEVKDEDCELVIRKKNVEFLHPAPVFSIIILSLGLFKDSHLHI